MNTRTALFIALAAARAALAQPADNTQYRAGLGLLGKGLVEPAAAELRAYLSAHPDGDDAPNARYTLAVCLWRLNKHSEAAKELDAVLAEHPAFEFAADARLLRGRCAQAAGDDRGVIAALATLSKDHPKFDKLDQAAVALAEAHYRLGAFAECRRAAGVVSSSPKSPSFPRAALFLAMADLALNDAAGAAEHAAAALAADPAGPCAPNAALLAAQARRRLDDAPGATALYERAAALAKDDLRGEALLGLAQLARSAGELSKAERALADAASLKPAQDLSDRLTLERGRLLTDQGKPGEALKLFAALDASKSARTSAEAALESARAETALGNAARAAKLLAEAAARHDATDLAPHLRYELADALGRAGDDKASLAAWDDWLTRYPKHPLARDAALARAWRLNHAASFAECREACRALLAADLPPTLAESTRLLLAENEFAAGKFDGALALYDDLLAKHPRTSHAWRASVRRALCMQGMGRADEAAALLASAVESPAGSKEPSLRRTALLALGEAALAKPDLEGAARRFSAVADDPEAGDAARDARLRLAIVLSRQGKPAEALSQLEKLRGDTNAARADRAELERAQCLAALNRTSDARAAFERLAGGRSPLAADARRGLAGIATREGRHEEAARLYAELAAGSPADALAAGASLLAAGKFAEAEGTLRTLIQPASDDKDGARTAAAARVNLGIAINRQGRPGDALPLLEPPAANLDPDLRAAAAYERALALRTRKKPEAAQAFRAALELPGRYEPYAALDLSELLRADGKHAESLELAERALKACGPKHPLRPRALYIKAAGQLALNKPAEAAAGLKDQADFAGTDLAPAAALLRGEALLAANDPRAAAEEFARAAARSPESVRGPAMLRLGDAHTAAQRWPEADAAYTAFLEAFPKSDLWFRARFGQGFARENAGRHDDAMAAYRDVAAHHTGATAARAQFQIGECLYAQKKLDQAVAEFAKTDVLFAVPEWSAAALYEAGRCLEELKKPEDAKRQFDDLLKRFPDSSWAKLAQKRPAPTPTAAASLPAR